MWNPPAEQKRPEGVEVIMSVLTVLMVLKVLRVLVLTSTF